MLVTIDNFNIDFIEDVELLEKLIEEYSRLELAIEQSAHYKLLAGKTQTLGRGKGVTRKERSRLFHTNNIANLVCEDLVEKIYARILESNPEFKNSDYLKKIFELNKTLTTKKSVCIAKAHDIGHVAFGHEGERAINNYFAGLEPQEVIAILAEHKKVFGEEYETEQGHISKDFSKYFRSGRAVSFEHNELSALLLSQIMKRANIDLPEEDFRQLILGVLAHSTSRVRKYELIEDNLPAQIVRAGDKVEYRNADYDELKALMKMDPDMPVSVVEYLQRPLRVRISQTTDELADELMRRGRIWESRSNMWETEPVMQRLSIFRRTYENAIFLYDSAFSYNLLKNELFPRLSDPEALRKFYEDHPGIDVFYPEDKVREIFEKTQDLEARTEAGEAPSLEADEIDEEIWDDTIPFKSVLQGENSERIFSIYMKVLEYYHTHPDQIPSEVDIKISPIDNKSGDTVRYILNPEYTTDIQRALEYVSLLDDDAMMSRYYELVEERIAKGPEHGIEPVTPEEMRESILSSYNASVKKFNTQELPTYSLEEAEKIYIQNGNVFYSEGLTPKGKETYHRFYAKRFAEYAIDQRLMQRMIEADRARGLVAEGEGFEEVEGLEGMQDENITKKLHLRKREDGQADSFVIVRVPKKNTTKKRFIAKNSALLKMLGRLGLLMREDGQFEIVEAPENESEEKKDISEGSTQPSDQNSGINPTQNLSDNPTVSLDDYDPHDEY